MNANVVVRVFFIIMAPKSTFSTHVIDDEILSLTIEDILKNSKLSESMARRGVEQTASLWSIDDGDANLFHDFCVAYFCNNEQEKEALFHRLCRNFELIIGHNNRVNIDLKKPFDVIGFAASPVDSFFAEYDGLAHFYDDMFESKLAFIVTLNFPFYSLKEKNEEGEFWSDLQWGYVRMGDMFTSRVPAKNLQAINQATSKAENYIANYNICMDMVQDAEGLSRWTDNLKLIAHWGLRDELKSAYSDKQNGPAKQKILYDIMNRIVNQEIPKSVIDSGAFVWNPKENRLFEGSKEIKDFEQETIRRYQYFLDVFRAERDADKFYPQFPSYIERTFDGEYEFSVEETERVFEELLTSPVVKKVAALISQRLGRKLLPYDIWYNGFKTRTAVSPAELDDMTNAKYPSKVAFENDLPKIMAKLGFSPQCIELVCHHVTVEASVGAGHALEAMMKDDNAMLRTRIGDKGMDYKGYNIGVHEFGHNVEQVISLHNVPSYTLRGVPNIACTEALAFTFQGKDLELLGVNPNDEMSAHFHTLDIFWNCYEIMGISLIDIKVWQWLYANPMATADELKAAVLHIAKEVWNKYYAPIFGVRDEVILSVYSHMIAAPLYLSSYPLGHLIDFQLEKYFEGKVLGKEVERIFAQGRLTPKVWLKKGVGCELSAQPLIEATALALQKVIEFENR